MHHSISQMKHQLDVTMCRFYYCRVTQHVSGASANHQEYLKLVQRPLVHVLSLQVSHHISLLGPPVCRQCVHGRTTYQPDLTTVLQPRHIPTQSYNITQSSAPDDGHMVARNMLSSYQERNKENKSDIQLVFLIHTELRCTVCIVNSHLSIFCARKLKIIADSCKLI